MSPLSPTPLPRGERGFSFAARRAWAVAAAMGWTPDVFWAATPQELADALAPPDDVDGPTREAMAALMARFPDEEFKT